MAHFPRLGPFYNPSYEQELLSDSRRSELSRNCEEFDRRGQNFKVTSFDRTSDSQNIPDKVQEGWTSHVRQQGDLFYVDVNGTNGYTQNSGQWSASSHHSANFHNGYTDHQNSRQKNWTHSSDHYIDNLYHKNEYSSSHEDYDKYSLSHKIHAEYTLPVDGHSQYTSQQNGYEHSKLQQNVHSEYSLPQKLCDEYAVPHKRKTNGCVLNGHVNVGSESYDSHNKRYSLNYSDDGFFDCDVSSQSSRMSTPRTNNKFQNTNHNHEHHNSFTSGKSDKFKCVQLCPNYRNCDADITSGVKLCEKMFGIILCNYNGKSSVQVNHNNNIVKDRKIIVQDVVPNSAAELCGLIYRGDMLQGINNYEVCWSNIDRIFQSLSNKKVKLTFQVPNVIGPKNTSNVSSKAVSPSTYKQHTTSSSPTSLPPKAPSRVPSGENIVQLVTGDSVTGLSSKLKLSLCSVMYLTLEEREDGTESGKDDILYWFPHEDNKVSEVRGLYLTLCGIMPEVTSSMARTSTLRSQGQLFHVAYKKQGHDLFVIALPANLVPLHLLECVMEELQRVILVLFKSLSSAFKTPRYHNFLDQLICLMLHSILKGQDNVHPLSSQSSQALHNSLPGTRTLDLTHDNKLLCDEILSEFEAADFEDLEEELPFDRRTFSILGTCLFYKDYLICNHLPSEDLRDIQLFMKYHCLLQLVSKQTVEELVVWREVFPTQLCHMAPDQPLGYSEPSGRWFLLIVGMKNFLLGTLLEAGGCAKTTTGNPCPDPFYISQAKATLVQLETDDVAMAECCQNRLLSERSGPSLVSADAILSGTKTKKDENVSTPAKSHGSPKSPSTPKAAVTDSYFKWSLGPYLITDRSFNIPEEVESDRVSYGRSTSYQGSESSTPVMKRQGSKLSYGSNDSGGSGSSAGAGKTPMNKPPSKAGSVFDMSVVSQSLNQSMTAVADESKSIYPIKVTKGIDNMLFYYLNFDHNEGVYVSPTPQEAGTSMGPVHTQVLHNFNQACLQLRKRFHDTLRKFDSMEDNHMRKFGEDSSFKCICEQGILFQCTPVPTPENKKYPPSPNYWVVGRLYPNKKELFVCFHESAPQTAIELAFRLSFGV